MEVVRIIDLKNYKGVNLLEAEESIGLVKEAVFYLHEKTKDLSDEEYINWLKNKIKNGFFLNLDRIELGDDLFQNPKFLFMKNDYEKLPFDIVTVIDIAVTQNGLIDSDYEHLIDAYW